MEGQNILIGQATAEMIAAWKKEHKRGIYGLTSEGHIAYFREPEKIDFNEAAALSTVAAPYSYFEILLKATKIGGSDELMDNPTIFVNATAAAKMKFESLKVEVVNL